MKNIEKMFNAFCGVFLDIYVMYVNNFGPIFLPLNFIKILKFWHRHVKWHSYYKNNKSYQCDLMATFIHPILKEGRVICPPLTAVLHPLFGQKMEI